MPSPTKDEAEQLLASLGVAWDSGNATLVNEHFIAPIRDLDEYAGAWGRLHSVEAVLPIDDRRALLVARSSPGGLVGCKLLRGRDGALRLEMGSMLGDPTQPATTLDAFLQRAELMLRPPRRIEQRTNETWRPAPALTPLEDIPYLGLARPAVSEGEFEALRAHSGAALPEGYSNYVTRFGEADDSGAVRVYRPTHVLEHRGWWRRRIDAYWFWAAAADGFDQDAAYESYVLADTFEGDEILWHPERAGFYVLPRNHDQVIARAMNFESVVAWAVSAGDLARVSMRRIAPLRDRVSHAFKYGDLERALVVATLVALGSGAVTSSAGESAVVAWPAHGLEVILTDDPYVALSHEPATSPAFVAAVLAALKPFGIERR